MIVLDTNVVSEIMRKAPEPAVMAWLNGLDANEVYLTSTVTGELLLGAARLPIGARQRLLQDSVQEILTVDFVGKILSFDWLAAHIMPCSLHRRSKQAKQYTLLTLTLQQFA